MKPLDPSNRVRHFAGRCRGVLSGAMLVLGCAALTPADGRPPAGDAVAEPPAMLGIAALPYRMPAAGLHLPISFEPNRGQAPAAIGYLARSDRIDIGLTPQGAVLGLAGARPSRKQSRLQIGLVGASAHPALQAEQPQAGVSNYFLGNSHERWLAKVPHYGAVRYRQVYPGIDWVLYGDPDHLEYDMVVAPHADAGRIRLRIAGADRLGLDADGDLVVQLGGASLRQPRPKVYQTRADGIRRIVDGRYVLERGQVAFALGDYDHALPLVIDPTLTYSSYLGGTGGWSADGIAVDRDGDIYVAGVADATALSNTLSNAGPVRRNLGGGQDIFIMRLDPSGQTVLYSTYLGGSDAESGGSLALDRAGNAYLTGTTSSTDFPTVAPVQAALSGPSDMFVAKLSHDGSTLMYSTYLGGSAYEYGNGIAVDRAGRAHVVGYTGSSDFPTANAMQGALSGPSDAVALVLDRSGTSLLYSTYLGGSGSEYGAAIAVDRSGNTYLAGNTSSSDFPVSGRPQSTLAGYEDAFVTKLGADGALVYSTYLGGTGYDEADGIAVDRRGNAYITGATGSTDFPLFYAIQPTLGGGTDAFVTKLDARGNAWAYSTYLGGGQGGIGPYIPMTVDDYGTSIAVDDHGHAYVAGYTHAPDFPLVDPLQVGAGGYQNGFITELEAGNNGWLFSTLIGGDSYDSINSIAVDRNDKVYIAGETSSDNFPTVDPIQQTLQATTDPFVATIDMTTTASGAPAAADRFNRRPAHDRR